MTQWRWQNCRLYCSVRDISLAYRIPTFTARGNKELQLTLSLMIANHERCIVRRVDVEWDGRRAVAEIANAGETRNAGDEANMRCDILG